MKSKNNDIESAVINCDAVHLWFNLTYASYLVLPRSMLQSMPNDWQEKFVVLLEKLQDAYSEHPEQPYSYMVRAKDSNGKFMKDFFQDYDRGRRFISPI